MTSAATTEDSAADTSLASEPVTPEGGRIADADMPVGTTRTRTTRWLVWILAFFAFLLPMASWSLATPEYGSPDEYDHVYRAAAVVRGEIVAPEGTTSENSGLLLVPKGFVDGATQVKCFAFKPGTPADCLTSSADDATLVEVESKAGRANPAYYLAVGWPSLFSPGSNGVFAIRLVSAALCAALLASAALSLAHGRGGRMMLAGLAVAATPMAFFLGGVVNPSGVAIAAALSVWAALLRLCTGHEGETGRLLRRFGIAASVLVLARGLSPVWLAVIALTCLLVANKEALLAVLRRRDTWLWVGLVAASTAASISWTLAVRGSGTVDLNAAPDRTLLGAMSFQARSLGDRLQEFVGVFGWTDTPSPAIAIALYALLLGGVVVAAITAARWRFALVLTALIGFVLLAPMVIEASQFNLLGLSWQSQYIMPVAVGIPLLAAYAFVGRDSTIAETLGRRPALIAVLGMGVVHTLGFGQALIRNQSGLAVTLDPLNGQWHPQVGSLTVLIGLAAGLVLLTVLVGFAGTGPSAQSDTDDLEPADRWYAESSAPQAKPDDQQPQVRDSTYEEYVDSEYDDSEYEQKDIESDAPSPAK